MDSGRAGQGDRLSEPVARQVLLIAGVSGFMDHPKQGAEQLVFVVTGGNAHVFRHAATERVSADVQTTGVKVKPEGLHRLQSQLALNCRREWPLRRHK